MLLEIILYLAIEVWLILNVFAAISCPARKIFMCCRDEDSTVRTVLYTLFFAPALVVKGLRVFIMNLIA